MLSALEARIYLIQIDQQPSVQGYPKTQDALRLGADALEVIINMRINGLLSDADLARTPRLKQALQRGEKKL